MASPSKFPKSGEVSTQIYALFGFGRKSKEKIKL